MEPGRFLVAKAGVLVALVTQLKGKGDVQYVGIATGMNSLIRPALYGAHHDIRNLTRLERAAEPSRQRRRPDLRERRSVRRATAGCRRTAEGDVLLHRHLRRLWLRHVLEL